MADSTVLKNNDILELVVAVPDGHRHLRATLRLRDGSELVLQEATLANLARAFLTVKTHPVCREVRLVGTELGESCRKEGFAPWQLLEADEKRD